MGSTFLLIQTKPRIRILWPQKFFILLCATPTANMASLFDFSHVDIVHPILFFVKALPFPKNEMGQNI